MSVRKDPTQIGEKLTLRTSWKVIGYDGPEIVLANCDGGKHAGDHTNRPAQLRITAEKLSDLYARSIKR